MNNMSDLEHFIEHKNGNMLYEEYTCNFTISMDYFQEFQDFLKELYPEWELVIEKEIGNKYVVTMRHNEKYV